MLVAEPFGSGGATDFELSPILEAAAARHRRGALAEVEVDDRIAVTAEGERIGYGVLLVALGAQPREAVPGALSFSGKEERARFTELLAALDRLGAHGSPSWSHRRRAGRSLPTSWPC